MLILTITIIVINNNNNHQHHCRHYHDNTDKMSSHLLALGTVPIRLDECLRNINGGFGGCKLQVAGHCFTTQTFTNANSRPKNNG